MPEYRDRPRALAEALLDTPDWLSSILDNAGAGIFILDRDARLIHTNTAMCRRLLYEPDDLVNKNALDLLDPADRRETARILNEMLAGKRKASRQQIRYKRRDGSIFWGDVSLSLVQSETPEASAFIGIVIDINRQKQAEEKLQSDREWYRGIFDKSGAASIIIEPDMIITMANEEFEKLTGYTRLEIEGRMKWSDIVAPADLEKMSGYHYRRRLAGEQVPTEYECRILTRSGEYRDIFIKVGMLADGNRSIASFMDITSLKKATHALKNSETKLLAITAATKGLIYTCNKNDIIEFMNSALVEKIGRDATGSICYQALYDRDSRCPWCAWENVFNGQSCRNEFENPVDRRWYDALMTPIYDENGAVSRFEALVIDITERKSTENLLKERELYLQQENIRLKSSIGERFKFGEIIGKSRPMQHVYELILNAAAADANVIINGESGTGKELVAQAVHNMSDRRQGAFVVVNCGAIPENLLESEFFGYKKGAFTGAASDKHGYLDLADGGTLFLDELGEIGLNMQVKLLRVIEGRGYRPVGGEEIRHPDIRIIAATNQNLTDLVRSGAMREDFFYRIHVIPILLPPLRDRQEDIPLLIDHFMRQMGDPDKLPPITGQILEAAMNYQWPGNIRELQNTLRRYVTLHRFELSHLSLKTTGKAPGLSPVSQGATLPQAVEDCEKNLILQTLEITHWHRGKAALILGINRRTLFKKMKRLGIDRSQNTNESTH